MRANICRCGSFVYGDETVRHRPSECIPFCASVNEHRIILSLAYRASILSTPSILCCLNVGRQVFTFGLLLTASVRAPCLAPVYVTTIAMDS